MPQSKILTDTNTYLRLANSIRPFLCIEFGAKSYCLYVLPETSDEIVKSSRLKTKFFWALAEEHCIERSKTVAISRKQKKKLPLHTLSFGITLRASCRGHQELTRYILLMATY
jgi:hypothetical protein